MNYEKNCTYGPAHRHCQNKQNKTYSYFKYWYSYPPKTRGHTYGNLHFSRPLNFWDTKQTLQIYIGRCGMRRLTRRSKLFASSLQIWIKVMIENVFWRSKTQFWYAVVAYPIWPRLKTYWKQRWTHKTVYPTLFQENIWYLKRPRKEIGEMFLEKWSFRWLIVDVIYTEYFAI